MRRISPTKRRSKAVLCRHIKSGCVWASSHVEVFLRKVFRRGERYGENKIAALMKRRPGKRERRRETKFSSPFWKLLNTNLVLGVRGSYHVRATSQRNRIKFLQKIKETLDPAKDLITLRNSLLAGRRGGKERLCMRRYYIKSKMNLDLRATGVCRLAKRPKCHRR